MAFSNGFKSPQDETSIPNYTSPIRTVSSQYVPQLPNSSSERAGLVRRFTTNTINTLPTLSSLQSPLSPIGQQRRQAAEQHDFSTNAQQQRAQSHLQREHAERLKQSSLRARQEAERLEAEYRKFTSPGHQSEPTTPPDLQESMLPSTSIAGRTNRFSLNGPIQNANTNSFHRSTLSGSQHNFGYFTNSGSQTPNNGQPLSHRNSDEEEEDDTYANHLPSSSRRAAVRNSMPVTNFDYRGMGSLPDVAQVLGINSLLLDDDDNFPVTTHRQSASIDRNSLLHMEHDENEFPMLLRRAQGESSSSFQTTGPSSHFNNTENNSLSSGWPSRFGHRQGQKSLPMNTLRSAEEEIASASHSRNSSVYDAMGSRVNNRHSMDVSLNTQAPQSNRSSTHMSPVSATMPNLRSSLSTNDIPTIGSLSLSDQQPPVTGGMNHEQRLHHHNATLGRIPPSAVGGHRREASIGTNRPFGNPATVATANGTNGYSSMPSASAPTYANNLPASHRAAASTGPVAAQMPYGLQQTTPPMSNGAQNQWGNQATMPYATANYNGAANFNSSYWYQQQQQYPMPRGPVRDSQQWVMAQRRGQKQTDDAMRSDNRFVNTPIEDHIGKIFEVSKDQNGCRYLQKKIEEDKANNLPLIFSETKDHIVELMKDPFGNYLCQKLLENCNADQRTILINNAAPSMVDIAVNQHGTRALQKMIEHISNPEQVEVIVHALGQQVVTLIQDLNGNHVIQKCLNHLRPDNAQFIFDAVGSNAYLVGTHRHGCCVLQRCIDHATGPQQEKLISEITGNAYDLMQDAYGNYVIQYILDLNEHKFTGPLCATFAGSVVELSKQKFSSNVIEKSMRMADAHWQRLMVIELLKDPHQMEGLLRDPFANYVVQTAIEHGPADVQSDLWTVIKPTLPAIRGTPCGRRLSQKLAQREGNRSGHTSGTMTPQEGVHTPAAMNGTHPNAHYNAHTAHNAHYNNMAIPPNTLNGTHTLHGAHSIPGTQGYHGNMNGGPGPQMSHTPQQHHTANQHGHSHSRSGQYNQYPAPGFF